MLDRDNALALYTSLGLATAPLRPRDKRPLFPGWQRADPATWNHVPPDANVGIVTGFPSGGLVVLDSDGVAPTDVLMANRRIDTRGLVFRRVEDCPSRIPAQRIEECAAV